MVHDKICVISHPSVLGPELMASNDNNNKYDANNKKDMPSYYLNCWESITWLIILSFQ